MDTDLKPISPSQEKPLDECPRVRWMGSNGGRQLGWLVLTSPSYRSLVLNEHTRTLATLDVEEWEYDLPKDDNGHPVNNDIQATTH